MCLTLHQLWLQNQVQGIILRVKLKRSLVFISLESLVIAWFTTIAFRDVTSCQSSKACLFIMHIYIPNLANNSQQLIKIKMVFKMNLKYIFSEFYVFLTYSWQTALKTML